MSDPTEAPVAGDVLTLLSPATHHQTQHRRWRGNIDIPLTQSGLLESMRLGQQVRDAGRFDCVYHDGLRRCYQTAERICHIQRRHFGPRPWAMGPMFEGQPITPSSLAHARYYVMHPDFIPPGGECFQDWYDDWMTFLAVQEYSHVGEKVAIVTHNRNIQAVYATGPYGFHYPVYDCDGPGFLDVHVVHHGRIEPWSGKRITPGIYLIRHGETDFGT